MFIATVKYCFVVKTVGWDSRDLVQYFDVDLLGILSKSTIPSITQITVLLYDMGHGENIFIIQLLYIISRDA